MNNKDVMTNEYTPPHLDEEDVVGNCPECGGQLYADDVTFNGGLDNERTETMYVCNGVQGYECDHAEPILDVPCRCVDHCYC